MYVKGKNGKRLIWINYHVINGPRQMERHHHAFLELSCVVRGTGTYQVNHAEYDMRPGDIFLFAPTDHHNLSLGQETLEHIVIHMDPLFIWNAMGNDMDFRLLMMFFQRAADFHCRLDRHNPAGAQLARLFSEIWQECQEQRDCYELMVKVKLQTILATIVRSYECIDLSKNAAALRSGDLESMNKVLTYIEEHLDGEIRLADLAAIAHVSTSYFSTLFKQCYGLPPVEYVVGQRIRRAIEYIRTTDMNLTDIATACGFNNSTNFYKAFHRVTGSTPASYRKPTAYDLPPEETPTANRQVFSPMPPAPVYECEDPCTHVTRPAGDSGEDTADPCGGCDLGDDCCF